MNKEEWDKAHNYTKERNCGYCKYARDISTNTYTTKLKCLEKEKDGAGAGVKTNYCCDLWENCYTGGGKNETGKAVIFDAVKEERKRQHEKWGVQNHEMLRCEKLDTIKESLNHFRYINDKTQIYDWYTIIQEEIAEAFSETDPAKQREEMVQAVAVAVQIIEYLDRKRGAAK
jgi:hypothetical protein